MKKFTLILLALVITTFGCSSDDEGNSNGEGSGEGTISVQAVYRVTFKPNFNATDFPTDYPANPSFSKILVAVHEPGKQIFTNASLASAGLQKLAEDGDISDFRAELALEGSEDSVDFFLTESTAGAGPTAEQAVNVTVDPDKTSISIIASLSPSPDWFVANLNMSVIAAGGETLIMNEDFSMSIYDAGTDDGTTYESPNQATDPQGLISVLSGPPFSAGGGLTPTIAIVNLERTDL